MTNNPKTDQVKVYCTVCDGRGQYLSEIGMEICRTCKGVGAFMQPRTVPELKQEQEKEKIPTINLSREEFQKLQKDTARLSEKVKIECLGTKAGPLGSVEYHLRMSPIGQEDATPDMNDIRQMVCHAWHEAVREYKIPPGSNLEKNIGKLLNAIDRIRGQE